MKKHVLAASLIALSLVPVPVWAQLSYSVQSMTQLSGADFIPNALNNAGMIVGENLGAVAYLPGKPLRTIAAAKNWSDAFKDFSVRARATCVSEQGVAGGDTLYREVSKTGGSGLVEQSMFWWSPGSGYVKTVSGRVEAISFLSSLFGQDGEWEKSTDGHFEWESEGAAYWDRVARPYYLDEDQAFSIVRGCDSIGRGVGCTTDGNPENIHGSHALMWGFGKQTPFKTPTGTKASDAYAINNCEQTTGWADSKAIIWEPAGGYRLLGLVTGAHWMRGKAINDGGIVAGNSDAGAWVFNGTAILKLGYLLNVFPFTAVTVSDVNERGQVVGTCPFGGFLLTPSHSLLSITPSRSATAGGTSVGVTVRLDKPAPAGGLAVYLGSTSSVLSMPASLVVGPGKSLATFSLATKKTGAPINAYIQARLGTSGVGAKLKILP